jgi:hypothetical protein
MCNIINIVYTINAIRKTVVLKDYFTDIDIKFIIIFLWFHLKSQADDSFITNIVIYS